MEGPFEAWSEFFLQACNKPLFPTPTLYQTGYVHISETLQRSKHT